MLGNIRSFKYWLDCKLFKSIVTPTIQVSVLVVEKNKS